MSSHQRQIDQVLGLGHALWQVDDSSLRMKRITRVMTGRKPAVLRSVRSDYEADLLEFRIWVVLDLIVDRIADISRGVI